MAKPRFRQAVERVARPMLEPLGFEFNKADWPGMGLYAFLRPWREGWNQGIALQTSLREAAFAVEIGVVRSDFWISAGRYPNQGPWRESGLRVRLGVLVRPDVHSQARDFIRYSDQATLEESLRREIQFALSYAPAEWERMGRQLLDGDRPDKPG